MKLHVLGSSSAGNGYLLTTNTGAGLILEAGVPFAKVNNTLDAGIGKVAGVLISHEHGDHSKYIAEYARYGIKMYASEGTIDVLKHTFPKLKNSHLWHVLNPDQQQATDLGEGFIVRPFHVKHDAAEPLGFLLLHPESGYILFVTDTHYIDKRFPPINNYIVECNYCEDILNENLVTGRVQRMVAERVKLSHLSIQSLQHFLSKQDTRRTSRIVLTHLSDTNSNEQEFVAAVKAQTGTETLAADTGLRIPFDRTPF